MTQIPVVIVQDDVDDARGFVESRKRLERRVAQAIRKVLPKSVDVIVTVQQTDGKIKVRFQPPDSGWFA